MTLNDHQYQNSAGQVVDISTMTNPHLLNAFNKYNTRAKLIREKVSVKNAPVGALWNYLADMDKTIKKLKMEIDKRGLMGL